MKDASYSLRVAYMEALLGLQYDGKEIFAYDEIAPDNDPVYIVISGQSFSESSLKCGFSTDHMISLNIICKYPIGSGVTKRVSEEIANAVLGMVYPSTGTTSVSIGSDFNIWNSRLVGNRSIIDETGREKVITKVLTFQHSINQIS